MRFFFFFLSFLADTNLAPGARSEVQECALCIGLLMFGIILERFIVVIKDALHSTSKKLVLTEDAKVMLPAIKVRFVILIGALCTADDMYSLYFLAGYMYT
jgi:hypothetical protein